MFPFQTSHDNSFDSTESRYAEDSNIALTMDDNHLFDISLMEESGIPYGMRTLQPTNNLTTDSYAPYNPQDVCEDAFMISCHQLGVVCGDGSTIPNTGVQVLDGYGIDTCGYLPVATGPAPTFTRLGTSAPNYGVECSESNNITNFTLPGTPLTSENLESCESNNITNFTEPWSPRATSSFECCDSNNITNFTESWSPLTTSGFECCHSNNITNFTESGTPLTSSDLEWPESKNITNFTPPGTPSTASSIEWPESNAIANLTPPGTPLTTSSPVLPSYPDPAPQSTAGQQASMIECLDGDIYGQTPYFVVPILASDPRDLAPVPVSPSLKRLPISRSLKRLTQPRARSPPCRYCGKDFSNNGNLGRHERETCSLNPPMHRCVRCGRGFPRKNNLDTHRTNGKCKTITRVKLNSKRASG